MAIALTNLEIKVIEKELGVSVNITRFGSAEIPAYKLGDDRRNSKNYYFHKQPSGEIFIRRSIKPGYGHTYWSRGLRGADMQYIYVIHRNPATNNYKGFSDVMDAAKWLKKYIRKNC